MRNKEIYLAMASRSVDLSRVPESVAEELKATVVTGVMFTRVWKEACRIAGIKVPEIEYKTALNRVNGEGYTEVSCKLNPDSRVIFTKVRRL